SRSIFRIDMATGVMSVKNGATGRMMELFVARAGPAERGELQLTEFLRFLRFSYGAARWSAKPAPILFVIAVCATTLDRILQTLALFLPIKILVLLSGAGPSMTFWNAQPEKDVLVATLMICVPLLYCGSIALTTVYQRLMDSKPS